MASPVHILFVTHDERFADPAIQHLERDFDVQVERTVDGAIDHLRVTEVDCVVGEHRPPDSDGLALLDGVRELDQERPVVLVADDPDEALAATASNRDAADYLDRATAGWPALLTARIEAAVDRSRLQAAVEDAEQRLAELEAQNETMRALAKGFPDLAYVIDEDGYHREYLAGPGAESLMYRAPEEMLDSRLQDVLPDPVAERIEGAIRRSIETGDLQTLEYQLAVPAGARWFEAHVTPVADDTTADQLVILVTRDVTERKMYEQGLERQTERFETLAGIVSHDLRNPLNVATGSVELARDEPDEAHLDRAVSALDRMDQLIDDVLAMVSSGQAVDDPEQVWLRDIGRRCWEHVETGAAELEITGDVVVWADPRRLRHVCENLFRNAVDNTSRDATVRIGGLPDGFYVEDDGPGIPPEDRDRAFEPGFSTTAKGEGFGLSIVEQMASAHGWDVSVTESRDGGARFEFTGVDLRPE